MVLSREHIHTAQAVTSSDLDIYSRQSNRSVTEQNNDTIGACDEKEQENVGTNGSELAGLFDREVPEG